MDSDPQKQKDLQLQESNLQPIYSFVYNLLFITNQTEQRELEMFEYTQNL